VIGAAGQGATSTALEMRVCLHTMGKLRCYCGRGMDRLLDEPPLGQSLKIADADVERATFSQCLFTGSKTAGHSKRTQTWKLVQAMNGARSNHEYEIC